MPLYESTFIARHDMSSQQVEGLAESVAAIVKENGGEITKTEFWGLKSLAYRIKKNRKGHYVFFNIDGPSAAVQELERNLRLNEDVLRYLTVRVDELDPDPSPMMQARSSRDDRSRRGGGPAPGRPRGEPAQARDAAKDAKATGTERKDTAAPKSDEKAEAAPKSDEKAEAAPKPDEKAEAAPKSDEKAEAAPESDEAKAPEDGEDAATAKEPGKKTKAKAKPKSAAKTKAKAAAKDEAGSTTAKKKAKSDSGDSE